MFITDVTAKITWLTPGNHEGNLPQQYDCFIIKTDKGRKFTVGITNELDCCEIPSIEILWDGKEYAHDEFDPDLILGADIVGVTHADDEYFNSVYRDRYECFASGIKIDTVNAGEAKSLYVTAVNQHNGYYPHDYFIKYTWVGQKIPEIGKL